MRKKQILSGLFSTSDFINERSPKIRASVIRYTKVMRQPMEDKIVTISHAKGSLTFPANFQLVAAMDPCPCGYYGDTQKPCTCATALVTKYQKRISGPLLDRIDIHVEVPRVDYEKLSGDRVGESSNSIRGRAQAARDIQRKRFLNNEASIVCNADMRVGGNTAVLQASGGRSGPDARGDEPHALIGAVVSPYPEISTHD